nr:MAG TPA: hypothetical protein [Caudoviricetes sp.]
MTNLYITIKLTGVLARLLWLMQQEEAHSLNRGGRNGHNPINVQ